MSTATDMLARYTEAEQAILLGQSVVWQGRSLTYADLEKIQNGRREWEARVQAEQAQAAGRTGARHVLADFTACG